MAHHADQAAARWYRPVGRQPADVLIDGEKIAALLAPGYDAWRSSPSRRRVDRRHRQVRHPRRDRRAHAHGDAVRRHRRRRDTFETGTRAAAWGGTTTIVDFAIQRTGEVVQDGLDTWHAKAEGNCAIDYGFHMIIGGVDEDAVEGMDDARRRGRHQLQAVHGLPGRVLLRRRPDPPGDADARGDNGAMIMMHAENGIAIDVLVQQALARGETAPMYHGSPGPADPEAEATHRAIMLAEIATDARCTSCTCRPSRRSTGRRGARPRACNVFAETCPQYLYLRSRTTGRARASRARSRCARPPLRSQARRHQDDLWKGLRTNDLAVVSTDHCPFCMKDQKELGRRRLLQDPERHRRRRAPHGPIYQGVVDGRISLRAGWRRAHDAGADVRACTRRRGRSRPAPTPTSSSGTRTHDRASASTRTT